MQSSDRITSLVLQEFRLHDADAAGEAARIVRDHADGLEPPVPLLTSIDDQRDVAIVRALHEGEMTAGAPAERAALEPLVASWRPCKEYDPRITERTDAPSPHYRLAVTESGINNAEPDLSSAIPQDASGMGTSTSLGLLWIGVPVGTYAGLLVLLGSEHAREAARNDPPDWPLGLSRDLGVRVYENRV